MSSIKTQTINTIKTELSYNYLKPIENRCKRKTCITQYSTHSTLDMTANYTFILDSNSIKNLINFY